MLRKIAIVAGLVALVSTTAALSRIPVPLLTWVQAVTREPELLRLIDGTPRTYDGEPTVTVLPVPGRIDRVRVLFPGGVDTTAAGEIVVRRGQWTGVDRTGWHRFAEVER